MENKMLKKLLDGLIFGTGFGIAFVGIWVVVIYFILPNAVESRFNTETTRHNEEVVSSAPSIEKDTKFLGSSGIYAGDFLDNKSGVLSSGEGAIVGTALVNEAPLKGERLLYLFCVAS